MKYLLLLLILTSCTPEQAPIETCNCELALYEDLAPVGCFVERENVELDCNTRQPINIYYNSQFIKCLDNQ